MKSVVIYGSNYGTTEKYAKELAKKLNINCINFKDVQDVNNYDTIIYLGGLYAGGVVGMKKTLNKIKEVDNKRIVIITVGLADPKDEENIKNIRNNISNRISSELFEKAKIFHLRGGIDYSKLGFTHKNMMRFMYNKIKKIPEENRSADVKGLIETYNKQVDFVDFNTLNDILEYIKTL